MALSPKPIVVPQIRPKILRLMDRQQPAGASLRSRAFIQLIRGHLLLLTTEYLASPMCVHEMDRALTLDPSFVRDIVVPVRRDGAVVVLGSAGG